MAFCNKRRNTTPFTCRVLSILVGVALATSPMTYSAAAQRNESQEARTTEFGKTALFETVVPPETPATQWNILAIGLFCGTKQLYPGRVVGYFYGINDDRLRTGEPLAATFEVDGRITPLILKPENDVALTPLEADFVRRLAKAHNALIQIKDYNSPNPERVNLAYADKKLKSALAKCMIF